MFHVVTGGSGSGKSAYAEEQICMLKKKTNSRHLYYIATMVPYGKETEQKILRHRQMRNGKGFETLECFTDLKKLVQTEPGFRADAAECAGQPSGSPTRPSSFRTRWLRPRGRQSRP